MKTDLSLKGSADRYGLTAKSDLMSTYIKNRVPVEAIPLKELIEYGLGDVKTTWELYQYQLAHPLPVTSIIQDVMNEFLDVLIPMESSGVKIDVDELDRIEREYREEHTALGNTLGLIIQEVMGDLPVNIESNEQLSQIIYSRKVTDKKVWKEEFNLGTELRNSVYKKKHPKYFSNNNHFIRTVKAHSELVYKVEQEVCHSCTNGKVRKIKKDGTAFKNETKCSHCSGTGFIYKKLDKIAGFKVTPLNSKYVASEGFSVNKTILTEVLANPKVKDSAKDFIRAFLRYSAITTYLDSFITNIKNNIKRNNTLYVNFNQCVTATGRLSSSNPNFQNLPRDKTFPIRRCIISRWKHGSLLDCDLAQLEFRVAAILSGDDVASQDILDGVDVHEYTAKVLTDAGQPTDRQGAKSHTFKPLYGGLSGTEAEVTYYKAFLDKYKGIAAWHNKLSEEAIATKSIISPSGRIYSFPYATRNARTGKASSYTQIVNYSVQGFATGDLTPCLIIELYKEMKRQQVKSLLILTVHDSVTADVYPGEEDVMIQLFKKVFDKIPEMMYNRFKLEIKIPIGYDLKIGTNWSNLKKVA
jgi:DNA polymerase I-like protein with 3'-5' exonuclease and polymerase domains